MIFTTRIMTMSDGNNDNSSRGNSSIDADKKAIIIVIVIDGRKIKRMDPTELDDKIE